MRTILREHVIKHALVKTSKQSVLSCVTGLSQTHCWILEAEEGGRKRKESKGTKIEVYKSLP